MYMPFQICARCFEPNRMTFTWDFPNQWPEMPSQVYSFQFSPVDYIKYHTFREVSESMNLKVFIYFIVKNCLHNWFLRVCVTNSVIKPLCIAKKQIQHFRKNFFDWKFGFIIRGHSQTTFKGYLSIFDPSPLVDIIPPAC